MTLGICPNCGESWATHLGACRQTITVFGPATVPPAADPALLGVANRVLVARLAAAEKERDAAYDVITSVADALIAAGHDDDLPAITGQYPEVIAQLAAERDAALALLREAREDVVRAATLHATAPAGWAPVEEARRRLARIDAALSAMESADAAAKETPQ